VKVLGPDVVTTDACAQRLIRIGERERLSEWTSRCQTWKRSSAPYTKAKSTPRVSWLWDGEIDVALGDELSGYYAEAQVSTFAEATAWLRDQACKHYPDSGFARKYCGIV
jgi:hypothetical protein